ncbi:MAG TPA: [protein-PII] uridylyltransferase [Candidatus Acidoferrales bacterium]|nr:[protein-PII] uridylyltransferase [Candidatus Acidoferrales bacterium]
MDAVAFSRSLLDETINGGDLKRSSRAYLQKARQLLLERHRAGAGGMEIVLAYTTMMDHLVRYLHGVASADVLRSSNGQNQRCAVVAQGGYGRGELNPYSDIDLLFLYSWKVSPFVEALTQRLLYALWDAGLEVGHATRSVNESIRLADTDFKVKTALLDCRFLCGDYSLYGDFEKAVERRLVRRRIGRFIAQKLAENHSRHENYGGSVYLLEPDVKEGEGGLRDIHTARWIARVKLSVRDLDGLALNHVISAEDVAKLKESQDFLLRVRNELHFSAGKHQDQLTFDNQEKVSQALHYEGEGALKAVEVFMRDYYLHASETNRLTSLIIHRITESGRSIWNGKYKFSRTVREGVRITGDQLAITNPGILKKQPGNLIQIFDDMQKYGCSLSHETRELVRAHLDLIDDNFRRSAAANIPFFEILKWKDDVYETLFEMHRAGVLGAFIPEFGRLLCMVLHDAYHIYTVDQHSLMLVREIERLKAGEYKGALPLLTQLARETEKIELLYLGMMFHDIGKGFGGGHSERGATMVRHIAKRMKLNVDDGALVEFLVRHHLLMTNTAFRRDLEDHKSILDFAKTMGTINNLKMLYLLTFADVKAVGPDVWNPWKASLLGELYVKTLNHLEEVEKGEFEGHDVRAVLRRIQGRVRRHLLKEYDADRVNRFIETMPERYFLATPESDMPGHFELMEEFKDGQAVISVEHFPERDCSSVVVCTHDRPGLFAAITGVLTALQLDILNARIFTSSDGRILDIFRVSHHGRSDIVMAEQKWTKFRTTLNGVLDGKIEVARLVESSRSSLLLQKRVPNVSTLIQIDNEASNDFTIVEVFTADRIGVLFTITHALHQLGLSIHVAKISTNVDQVADVFYVTAENGGKIEDGFRIETIRQVLQQSLTA